MISFPILRRFAAALSGIALLAIGGGGRSHAVVVNQPQTWADGDADGWRLVYQKSGLFRDELLEVAGGALGWTHPEDEPDSLFCLVARVGASGGAFTGDYFDSGVAVLRFEFFAETGATVEVELWHATDLLYFVARVPVSPGWQTVELPLDRTAFGPGFGSSTDFRKLLSDIGELWIGAERGSGAGAQVFRVRNLVLEGSGPGYAAWIQISIDSHGGSLDQWLPVADWDGDGFSNAREHVAGTDPVDPLSRLNLSISPEGNVLRWQSVPGRTYFIWRGPVPLREAGQVIATVPGTGDVLKFSDPEGGSLERAAYWLSVNWESP